MFRRQATVPHGKFPTFFLNRFLSTGGNVMDMGDGASGPWADVGHLRCRKPEALRGRSQDREWQGLTHGLHSTASAKGHARSFDVNIRYFRHSRGIRRQ